MFTLIGVLVAWRTRIGRLIILALVAVVIAYAALHPGPTTDEDQAASVQGIPSSVCGYDGTGGPVTSALLVTDAGPYPIYDVTCADGTELTYAKP